MEQQQRSNDVSASRKRAVSNSSAIHAFFSAGSSKISNSLSQLASPNPSNDNSHSNHPPAPIPPAHRPFHSLYERTLTLISRLYSVPDFEYYLFPGGIAGLLSGDTSPVIDPISILWGCFRLGAPFCHLLNQLRPRNILSVPDVTGITVYSNLCKKCVYHFLIGLRDEINIAEESLFTISELYKDDTNGLVKVIDVVETVLDEISRRGLAPAPKQFPFALGQVSASAQDNRSRSIAELLSTERSYIKSLQELMAYQQELSNRGTISYDLIHTLFSNLPELLDFQRRFLFSLEATLALPPEMQNIGDIFIQYEEGFQVYTPMCASYSKAISMALENQAVLAGGSIDPANLQGYLIKPIQRICRYPLLLKEIVKLSTPESFSFYEELRQAELVMKGVTDSVNEVQRIEDNRQLKESLLKKIDDLQGLNPSEWGDLLLYDRFPMVAQEVEQMYHIYLFELLVLCCKESTPDTKQKKQKSETFDIKGKIYSTSISDVLDTSVAKEGKFEVKVFWNEMEESFVLKCRNAEQADLWNSRIYACAVGNTRGFKSSRTSSGAKSLESHSSFRRNVHSVNANMFIESTGPPQADEERNRVVSLPAQGKMSRSNSELSSGRNSSHRRDASGSRIDYGGRNSSTQGSGQLRSPSVPLSAPPSMPPSGTFPNTAYTTTSPKDTSRTKSVSRASSKDNVDGPPKSSLPLPPSPQISKLKTSGPPKMPLPAAPPPNSPLPATPSAPKKLALPEPPSAPPKAALPQPPTKITPAPTAPIPTAPLTTAPRSPLPTPPSPKPTPKISDLSIDPGGASGCLLKMKTHYGSDIFILAVPSTGAKFEDILEKVERKIRICGSPMPEGRRIKLRYKDEDGDFITINSDEDIEMAFEMARRTSDKGIVTIQVE